MMELNKQYEGLGGQSQQNPIRGFTDGRKVKDQITFRSTISALGKLAKNFLQTTTPTAEYT